MQVRVAWSVELADAQWRKNEVELDETDLYRLLFENDLKITDAYQIPTLLTFKLLECEAQRLLLAMMVTRYSTAMRTSENMAELQKLQNQKDGIMGQSYSDRTFQY